MATWWEQQLDKGVCPVCGARATLPERSACETCLERQARAMTRWRRANRPAYNAYMREYMRKRRLVKQALVEKAKALAKQVQTPAG